MNGTALVVIGNGRAEYLTRAVQSSADLAFNFRIMVNDTGSRDYAHQLNELYRENGWLVVHHDHNLGMAAAVNSGWDVARMVGVDYIFHLEEDFVLLPGIELSEMRYVLDQRPELAELTLKRNCWAPEEYAAGGQIPLTEQRGHRVVERSLHRYANAENPSEKGRRLVWSAHEALFSLNPSLIPARTFELGWPRGPLGIGNESGMTQVCLDRGMHFAYWRGKEDPPLAEHIGFARGVEWQL